mmetsp:Transcript_191/g.282  ORF Transcript_191/g.282 Transcript_191/m.282 type:complete len:151 (-) Transcript_191:296-748(-)
MPDATRARVMLHHCKESNQFPSCSVCLPGCINEHGKLHRVSLAFIEREALHCLDRSAACNHSSPSYSPSPVAALQPWMYHLCFTSDVRHMASATLFVGWARGMSCLLASTRTTALRKRSSERTRCISSLASANREGSFESTMKINASLFS